MLFTLHSTILGPTTGPAPLSPSRCQHLIEPRTKIRDISQYLSGDQRYNHRLAGCEPSTEDGRGNILHLVHITHIFRTHGILSVHISIPLHTCTVPLECVRHGILLFPVVLQHSAEAIPHKQNENKAPEGYPVPCSVVLVIPSLRW